MERFDSERPKVAIDEQQIEKLCAMLRQGGMRTADPDPARFALHKLVTSQLRAAAFQAKARKDLEQAAQLLEVLLEDRHLDIESAWKALQKRGDRWTGAVLNGLAQLERAHADLAASVRELM